MTAPLPRRGVCLLALAAMLTALAGCGGLLGDPPKRQLYRIEPNFAFAAPLPRRSVQLLVATPSAPASLDTARIALSRGPVSLDYFAESEWSDRVPFLAQAAIVEGFEKSRALSGVGPESLGLRADFVLETAIRDFQAVYDTPDGPPHVRVTLNAKLVGMPERRIIGETTITGDAKAAANAVSDIVPAFAAALGRAVADLVGWTVANPALSAKRGSLR